MKNNLSVILIAHNEEQAIGAMIEGLLNNYQDEILEIIIVDDASTDKTPQIVESWRKQNPKVRLVRRTPPCGVGRALKAGFSSINPKADYVLTMDSDFIESIKDVRRLIQAAEGQDCDGAIGSRFVKGGRLINYPFGKKVMNRSFHFIVKALFRIKQNDLTNNFKLYKAGIFRELPWRSNDYAMNAETGILPIISGYRIQEVPVSWVGRSQQMGKSKFRLFKVGASYARVILYARQFLRLKKQKAKSL
jgi:glycosyltransferase involved in cell wall biosynthesis